MRHRIAALLLLWCATLLAAPAPPASLADQTRDTPPLFYPASAGITAPATSADNQRLLAMVELVGPAAVAAPSATAIVERGRQLSQVQAGLAQRLSELEASVLFQTRLVYNGIAVSVPASRLAALRALPGVARVHLLQPKQRSNAGAVPFVGAPGAWSAPGGITGRGIRIGIVDTGVDYTHADFGGPGTPAAYVANDPALVEPGSFPTAKVIGGFDFAGNAYDAEGLVGSPTPAPDPDPLDCNGHGTHVAGTAAGYGVTASGATYTGPYDSSVDFSAFSVGPGVAPEASIYALKIFGCQGSTVLLPLAVERALDPNGDGDPADRLDVLNISISSPFGSPDDPDAVAINNAVLAGMVVVAAAGDSGNTFYSVAAPASAPRAIAVGASVDLTRGTPILPADSLAPSSSRGPQRGNHGLKPDLVAPGLQLQSAAVGTGIGGLVLSGTSTAAPQVAGAAALLRQLHPGWDPERVKAALMNTAAPVQTAAGTPYPPSLAGAGRLELSAIANLDILAYAADEGDPIALTYGAPWIAHSFNATRTLRLENIGDVARDVTLTATSTVTEAGVTISLPSGPITIPPGSHADVPVTMQVDPALLDFTPDASTPIDAPENVFPRYFLAEHGGYVQIQAQGDSVEGVRIRPANAADIGAVSISLDDQLLDDSIGSGRVEKYFDTTSGTHTVRVVIAASDLPPVLTTSVNLQEGRDYTAILVGSEAALGLLLVDETPPAPPAADRALVHFVNANLAGTAAAIPLDVYLDGVLRFEDVAPGAITEFIEVSPDDTHTAAFYRAGANPTNQNLVALESFSAKGGFVFLVGAGQHEDIAQECNGGGPSLARSRRSARAQDNLCAAHLRGFSARAEPRNGPITSQVLRVPFQIFPKSAAEAQVLQPSISVPPGTNNFLLGLQNTGARNAGLNGSTAVPQTPLVSAFELAALSPARTAPPAADVQYLGVTNNFSVTQQLVNTAIFFGIATYGPWSTPNEVEFRIFIDSTGPGGVGGPDGVDDYMLLNTSYSAAVGNPPGDVFIVPLFESGAPHAIALSFWNTFQSLQNGFDVAPFNTSVVFLAVSANLIGLAPGETTFHYRLETRSRDVGNFQTIVDRVPEVGSLVYDVATPALAPVNTITPILARRPLFLDVDGGSITGAVNTTTLLSRGGQANLLILHHHNQPAQQAEVVQVVSAVQMLQSSPNLYRAFIPIAVGD